MRILCIGGGPANLYFALCMKLQNPKCEISIIERNHYNITNGWGVIISDKIVEKMLITDKESTEKIIEKFTYLDEIKVFFKNENVINREKRSCSMSRLDLLLILQDRCKQLGVSFDFEHEFQVGCLHTLPTTDLIVIGDGVNSKTRAYYASQFGVIRDVRPNKYKWLGIKMLFGSRFNFIFEQTEHGLIWAHCYQFNHNTSTFVVECTHDTWQALGFDLLDECMTLSKCEQIFRNHLLGHQLMSNTVYQQSVWNNFSLINCQNWYYKNTVMLGDAAHTIHFSVGSGTRLALEDAQELSKNINAHTTLEAALVAYQNIRKREINGLCNVAHNSMLWFENVNKFKDLSPSKFVRSLLNRRHGSEIPIAQCSDNNLLNN